jgi:hypothetical protein
MNEDRIIIPIIQIGYPIKIDNMNMKIDHHITMIDQIVDINILTPTKDRPHKKDNEITDLKTINQVELDRPHRKDNKITDLMMINQVELDRPHKKDKEIIDLKTINQVELDRPHK